MDFYILDSDDEDFSTEQSEYLADMTEAIREGKFAACYHWYFEIFSWLLVKFDIKETFVPIERDDRLTGLACYAAFMSVDLVMKELFLDKLYHYCGPGRTIKCIHEAVLACFDLLSKNLLIDKSAEVSVLRDYIITSAHFAPYYFSSHATQLPFQESIASEYDHTLLFFLQGNLTGKYPRDKIFSEMQPSTKVMDDDVVGLDGDLMKIKERLMRSKTKLNIIPVVGMGGIGKTTLTRKVYMDPEIISHFHVKAWIVVSQEFRERDVLLGLLESIAPLPSEVYEEETEQLAEILYRRLKGWRYFIVLDDIWTTKAWNHIKLSFPDDNNGSRIVLTSRITELASYIDSENPPYFMNFC